MEKRVGAAYRPDWIMITIWFLVGFMVPSLFANGESWVPEARHMKARHHGDDCNLYRSLARKTAVEIKEAKSRVAFYDETLKKARKEIETCARAKGIQAIKSDRDEQIVAELCPAVYEAWLSPGYRLLGVRQEIESAREGLSVLRSHIDYKCGALPVGYKVETSTEGTVAPAVELMPASPTGSATNLIF